MAAKGIDVRIPPLVIKENSELECWKNFMLRFEIGLINTNMAIIATDSSKTLSSEEKSENKKIDYKRGGLLLNTIGEEGYKIFASWNIAAADISYEEIVGRFEERFLSRQNLFVTRHRFLSLEQISSEKIEEFIDRVIASSIFCNFGDLEEEMVLQIITKGLRDDKLRKELLYTKEINLSKAKNICHLYCSAETSNTILTEATDTEVAFVRSRGAGGGTERRNKLPGVCHFCKLPGHWIRDCQKRKKIVCEICQGRGHSAKVCKKKAHVQEIVQEDKSSTRYSANDSDESF